MTLWSRQTIGVKVGSAGANKRNEGRETMQREHIFILIYSPNCLNGHLFQPVICLYSHLSVTPLRFHYLFDACITVSAQRGHGQSFFYTQMTTNEQSKVNRCQVNSFARKAVVSLLPSVHKCAEFICRLLPDAM